jgi:hypothetical protein
MQAVELDDTGIALEPFEPHALASGQPHQPRRDRRPDDNLEIGPAIQQGVDDFDRSRGMAKTVAGDIEDDRGHRAILRGC